MPIVIPYVPEYITVHLGRPSESAPNVTVSFQDYVKNVACSEIYPTWHVSALRANILAIVSFALNRVYTEYYRSRGYSFDITASTAFDQKFINGRNFFENISTLVDALFNSYLRRETFVEPLAAKFCNGTTVTCAGLSQWGSEELAQQGYDSVDILQHYYGDDIEIVSSAPIQALQSSYPGTPLQLGSIGPNVSVVQVSLNRISQNYPAIPKINPVDGIFGADTENSVRVFQSIFGLVQDGIVGRETWYQLVQLYVAVTRLAELQSEGQTFYNVEWSLPAADAAGRESFTEVSRLQYMLLVISQFIIFIPPLTINGQLDTQTHNSVSAFQRYTGLHITGDADAETMDAIYNRFFGIQRTVFHNPQFFPLLQPLQPASDIAEIQRQLGEVATAGFAVANPAVTGILDSQTRTALLEFQNLASLPLTGQPDTDTRLALATAMRLLSFSSSPPLVPDTATAQPI